MFTVSVSIAGYDDNILADGNNFDEDQEEVRIEAGVGVGSSTSSAGHDSHEDAECAKGDGCIYIGCARCLCDRSVVSCHQHFTEFCQWPMSEK